MKYSQIAIMVSFMLAGVDCILFRVLDIVKNN